MIGAVTSESHKLLADSYRKELEALGTIVINPPESSVGDKPEDHRQRLEILESKLGFTIYYGTGHLHNMISEAMQEYANQETSSLRAELKQAREKAIQECIDVARNKVDFLRETKRQFIVTVGSEAGSEYVACRIEAAQDIQTELEKLKQKG